MIGRERGEIGRGCRALYFCYDCGAASSIFNRADLKGYINIHIPSCLGFLVSCLPW